MKTENKKKLDAIFEIGESFLSRELDLKVYLPVKEELKDCGISYSLGQRKELYKTAILICFKSMKKEIEKICYENKNG